MTWGNKGDDSGVAEKIGELDSEVAERDGESSDMGEIDGGISATALDDSSNSKCLSNSLFVANDIAASCFFDLVSLLFSLLLFCICSRIVLPPAG